MSDEKPVAHELDPASLKATIEASGGLIGTNASARVLGVAPSNFNRHKPRLTEIEVEGSASVFVKDEVTTLGEELEEKRTPKTGDEGS